MLTANPGDLLCIVANQGTFEDGLAEVEVTDAAIVLEIDPPELTDAVHARPYPFRFKASQIPKKVERVRFEWDFGDGIDDSQGFDSSKVEDGEAHHHPESAADKELHDVLVNQVEGRHQHQRD